jgi:transposase-like protein
VALDHTTIYRWIQHYAPELKKRLEWYKKRYSRRWPLDETYIKIKGEWKYLYRAIDESGKPIDFYLSHRRNAIAGTSLNIHLRIFLYTPGIELTSMTNNHHFAALGIN